LRDRTIFWQARFEFVTFEAEAEFPMATFDLCVHFHHDTVVFVLDDLSTVNADYFTHNGLD
jgi:hypothetical protein